MIEFSNDSLYAQSQKSQGDEGNTLMAFAHLLCKEQGGESVGNKLDHLEDKTNDSSPKPKRRTSKKKTTPKEKTPTTGKKRGRPTKNGDTKSTKRGKTSDSASGKIDILVVKFN
jgi:hypothetical protein